MMLFRVLSFAVFLLVGSSVAIALEPDQVFAKVSKSIVVVGAAEGGNDNLSQGSGVIIAPGEIVTNCHVVENAVVIAVARESYKSIAKLRFSDPDRDLCQLSVVDSEGFESAVPRTVEVADLRVGQKVYAIGSPQGLDLTLSDGLISSIRDTERGSLIQTTAPISTGSSGGGLFDSDGRLIGITTFIFRRGQNLNFAIPASWIADLPSRHAEITEEMQSFPESAHAEMFTDWGSEDVSPSPTPSEHLFAEQQRQEAEQKRLDLAQKQRLAEQQRLREERDMVDKQGQEELARKEEARSVAAARAAQQEIVDEYWVKISAKLRSKVVMPPDLSGNPVALYEVVLFPGGDVLSATLKKSSGVPAYDAAVLSAIMAGQPLPVPSDPILFQDHFRKFNMKFRPKE